jgi:hypothetical protein
VNGSTTADQSLSDTATIVGTLQIPANSIKAGCNINITCSGRHTWEVTHQATLYIKCGTLKIVQVPITFPLQTNQFWRLTSYINFRTNASANTSVAADISFIFNEIQNKTGQGSSQISNTVDATINNTLDIGIAYSQVDVTDLMSCELINIEATFL